MEESRVYIIEHSHGHVKIGRSTNPERRLADIKNGSPYELSLLTTIDPINDQDRVEYGTVENFLHTYFDRFRMRGEWFSPPPPEVSDLECLDELRASDLARMIFDLFGRAGRRDGNTLVDYLHQVWVLDYDPQERDR